MNLAFRLLTDEQGREIDNFLKEYKNERGVLDFSEKIFLWDYFHCGLINKVKAMTYRFYKRYKKYRKLAVFKDKSDN